MQDVFIIRVFPTEIVVRTSGNRKCNRFMENVSKIKRLEIIEIEKMGNLNVRRKWKFNCFKDNRNGNASCSDAVMLNSQPITPAKTFHHHLTDIQSFVQPMGAVPIIIMKLPQKVLVYVIKICSKTCKTLIFYTETFNRK